jgi:hypothetical protein
MTTTSSVRNIKPRLATNNSGNSMTTNGNEIKPSRIFVKKPLSTTNFLQNNSTTNGFSNHLKKRTLQLNNFFYSKTKSNQTNGHQSDIHSTHTNGSTSPPAVFHAIAPASSEQINDLSKQISTEQKVLFN